MEAEPEHHLELLIHRNDSVAALVKAFAQANIAETAKWIVYRECRSFFDAHNDELIQDVSRYLDDSITKIRPVVLQTIAQELQGRNVGIEPEGLLTWYERQFAGSQK